eukprot:g11294.t1 g11294   contig5:541016-542107(-)
MEEKKTEDPNLTDEPVPKQQSSLRPSPTKVEPTFTAPYGPNLHVSKHPVLAHKLSILRSSSTSPSSFRSTLREITFHLGYEATSTLTTRDVPLTVPGTDHKTHIEATGTKLAQKVALIPILRSGLGMVDSMLELISSAEVHHIGMYRSKSLMPVHVAGILKKWGVSEIHVVSVIASKQGLSELMKFHPDVHVTLGHIDEELNADGDVMPGLGDAGDRLFGTPLIEDEEELVHPSKRKRTMSVDDGN